MKRTLLVSSLVSLLLTGLSAADWEVTPVAGAVFPDSDTHLDTQTVLGGEFQYNGFGTFFSPELQILQSLETDYDKYPGSPTDTPPLNNGSTFVNRAALNAVHDFDTKSALRPFFKVGIGYESFYDYHYFENNDGAYLNGGLGLKYLFTDTIALKLEGLWLHRFNKRDDLSYDNNYAALAGITFAFGGGETQARTAGVSEKSARTAGDEEAARAKAAEDEARRKAAEEAARRKAAEEAAKASAAAAAAAALAEADDDGDGVRNADDLCPGSPKGMQVDGNGCAVPPPVDLTYAVDSAVIAPKAFPQLDAYAAFLQRTGKRVRVVGHTDNSGTETYNKSLSLKRAKNVADYLISRGVPAQNVEMAGRGDTEPIMSNATPEGRAANRRVELHLIP